MKVLSVASEIFPLVKTGGLADVVGALPAALAPHGIAMTCLVPAYPAVSAALKKPKVAASFDDFFGGAARILSGRVGAVDLLALDAPHLYERPGNIYTGLDGKDWPDNALRFGALSFAAAAVGRGAIAGYAPDIVHSHDWQAGLAPAYLHFGDGPRPATVISVHNLAFQGQFDAKLLNALRLPPNAFTMSGVEYYGTIGFLKAGLQLADRITTVSPTYAMEIRGAEAGMGLEGLLRQRSAQVSGILNGLDAAAWDPASDEHIAMQYERGTAVSAKARNKKALQQRLGLDVDAKALVLGVVSRLSWQKGLDLLLEAMPALVGSGAQLAMLGSGEPLLEAGYARAAQVHGGRVGVAFAYDEPLAHLIQAGSDALLVPSRFEPCGLTQLAALRYGTLPVVARVGGLADTVIDANEVALAAGVATGVQFAPVTREALEGALLRTAALWRDRPAWRRMQANAMRTDVSWTHPARRYAALYKELLASRSRTP